MATLMAPALDCALSCFVSADPASSGARPESSTYDLRCDVGAGASERLRERDARLLGALIGHACGDALGAPAEFLSSFEAQRRWDTVDRFVGGGNAGWEPGEWTDDHAMTLCVAEGILESPNDPVEAIGQRFLAWYDAGPKDVGGTILEALRERRRRTSWHEAARHTPQARRGLSAGNGSLMRVLPVALAYADKEEMLRRSAPISAMTHWDAQAEATCAIYCLWLRHLLRGEDLCDALFLAIDEVELRVDAAGDDVQPTAQSRGMLLLPDGFFDRYRRIPELAVGDLQPTGYAGYVVHAFEAAAWCALFGDDLDDVLVRAVALGGETDTIAAIAGGAAGAFHGHEPRLAEGLWHADAIRGVAHALGELRHRRTYDTPGLPELSHFHVHEHVSAGRNPLTTQDVAELHERYGIDSVLDLREPREWLDDDRYGAEAVRGHWLPVGQTNVPIPDTAAPTFQQLDRAVAALEEEGHRTYVHCRAGVERTGAVLVAWLARRDGLGFGEALVRLRQRDCPIAPLPHQRAAVEAWLEQR